MFTAHTLVLASLHAYVYTRPRAHTHTSYLSIQAYHLYDQFLRRHPAVDTTEGSSTGGIRSDYAAEQAHALAASLLQQQKIQQRRQQKQQRKMKLQQGRFDRSISASASASASGTAAAATAKLAMLQKHKQYPSLLERLTGCELIKIAKHAMAQIDKDTSGSLSAKAAVRAATGGGSSIDGGAGGGSDAGAMSDVAKARTRLAKRQAEVNKLSSDTSHLLTEEERSMVKAHEAKERHRLQKAKRGMRLEKVKHARMKRLGRL
jgi:hypothetical protein